MTVFLKIFRRFSKIVPKARRTFPNSFRKFPKISEDSRRLPKTFEEDPKTFRWHTNESKYNLRDKFDISEIIDIFTSEDIIIIFTCEDIVLFLSISYHSVYPGGNERPSHNPLFWTILSKSVAHVTIHFDRVSECSVRPCNESSVTYLHCIDLSTEKFNPDQWLVMLVWKSVVCLGTSVLQAIWP